MWLAREWKPESVPELGEGEVAGALESLLSHPTMLKDGSRQYDHMVMSGCTVNRGAMRVWFT